jgi:DNA-directed RNA polymerase delta subunit
MSKNLIDLAYEYARTNFKKNPFTFNDLLKAISKQYKLSSDEQEVGYLYLNILQDQRFIYSGSQN